MCFLHHMLLYSSYLFRVCNVYVSIIFSWFTAGPMFFLFFSCFALLFFLFVYCLYTLFLFLINYPDAVSLYCCTLSCPCVIVGGIEYRQWMYGMFLWNYDCCIRQFNSSKFMPLGHTLTNPFLEKFYQELKKLSKLF